MRDMCKLTSACCMLRLAVLPRWIDLLAANKLPLLVKTCCSAFAGRPPAFSECPYPHIHSSLHDETVVSPGAWRR